MRRIRERPETHWPFAEGADRLLRECRAHAAWPFGKARIAADSERERARTELRAGLAQRAHRRVCEVLTAVAKERSSGLLELRSRRKSEDFHEVYMAIKLRVFRT